MAEGMQETKKPSVWDCGSNLYDSFERKSFERHLDSAISSRSYSMPHERFAPLPQQKNPPIVSAAENAKKSSVASKSIIRKFLQSVFRAKPATDAKSDGTDSEGDAHHDLYPINGRLPAIPESREKDYGPAVIGKSVSERFAVNAARISCA